MSSTSIGSRLEAELGSIAERCGCELLAARFAGSVLRLVLDHENGDGGVTLEECERVSREASTLLDVEDFASGGYVLEVSSPGLDREFYRESDYERFAGRQVKVTWRDPETTAKRTDVGTLDHVDGDGDGGGGGDGKLFTLTTDAKTLTIRLSDVITTRLEPVF